MRYRVVIPKNVQKRIDEIPEPYQGRVRASFAWLENDPYAGKRLVGDRRGEWTHRIGPFRVLYRIKTMELVVLITSVGHRKDVYR